LLCNDGTNDGAEFGDMHIDGVGGQFLEIEEDAFKAEFVFASLGSVFFFESVPDLSGSVAIADAGFCARKECIGLEMQRLGQ
jgi:hypothetical protein